MAKTFKTTKIGIYKITSPKGKIYIGQSKHIEKRFYYYQRGRCEQQRKLYNSLFKHGWENHIFEIIEECEESELDCRERHWQDFYDVKDREKGLNCILTACGDKKELKVKRLATNKHTWTEEQRKKMSEKYLDGSHPLKNIKKSEFQCFKFSVSKRKISETEKQELLDNFNEGDWFNRVKPETSRKKGHNKCKIVVDMNTGVFYNSLKEVCALYNYSYDTMKQRLRGVLVNNTPFIYA